MSILRDSGRANGSMGTESGGGRLFIESCGGTIVPTIAVEYKPGTNYKMGGNIGCCIYDKGWRDATPLCHDVIEKKNCIIYEGLVFLPYVFSPYRIGGKILVPLCGPLRQTRKCYKNHKNFPHISLLPNGMPPWISLLVIARRHLRNQRKQYTNRIIILYSFCRPFFAHSSVIQWRE